MFNKSLTVVLPVHNGETRLRKNVSDILELASELTPDFGVLIIDDGSNDDTYELAEELAAHYPQVRVHHQRQRQGLGSAIDYTQRRVRTDAIILHDGVTPIDASEIRGLWQRWIAQSPAPAQGMSEAAPLSGAMAELANLPAIHAAMERAHKRVLGFQMLTPLPFDEAFAEYGAAEATNTPRNENPLHQRKAGIGEIPAMPRPKFLTAITNFALGE
ncbi:MAG: glycosyltransferase family 2 protein [Pirellulales bacterium]|nr:glycosyltransferase family 2 protein [Pirellulales bacterium]